MTAGPSPSQDTLSSFHAPGRQDCRAGSGLCQLGYSLWKVRVIERGLQNACGEHCKEGGVSKRPAHLRLGPLAGHRPLPIWFLLGR